MAFEFTDANFKEKALETDDVVIVDFWAEWCGPCKIIAPLIEELATDYKGKALVGKLDVDNNPNVAMQFGIRSIPTVLILKNGAIVDKQVGTSTKAALAEKIEGALALNKA